MLQGEFIEVMNMCNAEVERREKDEMLHRHPCKHVQGDDEAAEDEFFADGSLCMLASLRTVKQLELLQAYNHVVPPPHTAHQGARDVGSLDPSFPSTFNNSTFEQRSQE